MPVLTLLSVCDSLLAATCEPHSAVLANLEEWADAVEGRDAYRFEEAELIGNIAVIKAIARSVAGGGWVEV